MSARVSAPRRKASKSAIERDRCPCLPAIRDGRASSTAVRTRSALRCSVLRCISVSGRFRSSMRHVPLRFCPESSPRASCARTVRGLRPNNTAASRTESSMTSPLSVESQHSTLIYQTGEGDRWFPRPFDAAMPACRVHWCQMSTTGCRPGAEYRLKTSKARHEMTDILPSVAEQRHECATFRSRARRALCRGRITLTPSVSGAQAAAKRFGSDTSGELSRQQRAGRCRRCRHSLHSLGSKI